MDKRLRLILTLGVVLLLCVGATGGWAILRAYQSDGVAFGGSLSGQTSGKLPVLFEVPAFSLTDQRGETVTRDDLRGKVWVADFFFTTCTSICPLMTRDMAQLQSKLAQRSGWQDVRLVSFSVDPERDTPAALAKYAKEYHADGSHWFFLTGERAKLWTLIRDGFKLAVEPNAKADAGSLILHSPKWALVDRQGRIRGYYDSLDAGDRARLTHDIARLLAQ